MLVRVEQINEAIVQLCVKHCVFRCNWGTKLPLVGKDLYVEFDTGDILTTKNICFSEKIMSIQNCQDGFQISGYVDSAEDSILFLQVFDDLIMIQFDNTIDIRVYIGRYVSVFLNTLTAYPIF